MGDETSLVELVRAYQAAQEMDLIDEIGAAIVARITKRLHLFLWGRCGSAILDDILQATYEAIFDGFESFQVADERKLWNWMFTIARRKAIDHGRQWSKTSIHESIEDMVAVSNPKLPVTPPDDFGRREILSRLKAINPVCFEYLWNHFVVGLTLVEMAESYGIKEDAMRMRVKRCRDGGRKGLSNVGAP